jgi:lipopolysaccharide export system permease protein
MFPRRFGKTARWLFMAFLSGNFYVIFYSQHARAYALMLALAVPLTFLFLQISLLLRKGRVVPRKLWLWWGILLVLLGWSHYFGMLFFGITSGLLSVQALRSRKNITWALLLPCVVFACFLPWLVPNLLYNVGQNRFGGNWWADKAPGIFIWMNLVSFFFANNVIPDAQYKFINLRKTIVQQKPAMAIAEGQFNSIGTSNIKVGKKSGDNGQFLEDVTMHVKNNNMGLGANTIIKAKRGILTSEDDSNYLQLELYDGYYYEDIHPKNFEERKRLPFAKSSFKKYVINIDLTKLNQSEIEDGDITSEKMLTALELKYTIDSLQKNYDREIVSFTDNIIQRNDNLLRNKISIDKNSSKIPKDLFEIFSQGDKIQIIEMAKNNVSGVEYSIQSNKIELENKIININNHWLAIHEKFVIAYSCLLMFFIGAPLGAIIRKGGLGLPIVFAILIFISFHFINTFGRKVAQQDTISPFLGAWMASLLMTPFAIILTYRATNDIGIMINFDWITDPFKKLFNKITQNNDDNN